ncbi:MAG: HD domain-containing protein [Candidatus Eremiobacteraeota bacterium]|nr:HD domain-containing protein [Candidatus Eremiobacteraeota bacterium]
MHEAVEGLFVQGALAEVWDHCRQENIELALVGGAVRDRLLGTPTKDLDLVVDRDAFALARRFADQLGATFVPLDPERQIARLALKDGTWLDFALLVGERLEDDLANRDFTINAMAIHPDRGLVDPLGGQADLEEGRLRLCGSATLENDPLRCLRAIRMLARYPLEPAEGLLDQVRRAVPWLSRVSMERVRDELFFILEAGVSRVLDAMEYTNLLFWLFPELEDCQGCEQNHFHHLDVLDHTLLVVRHLEALSSEGLDLRVGEHLSQRLVPNRSRFALLKFCSFLHDLGKPATQTHGRSGRIHFRGHDLVGAEMAEQVAARFMLSRQEIRYVEKLVRLHLKPVVMPARGADDRQLHRFFREAGELTPDLLVHSRADVLATRGPAQSDWLLESHRLFMELMLEDFFGQGPLSAPPMPLTGDDLLGLGLKPGSWIGALLAQLREDAVEHDLSDRETALAWARRLAEPLF